MSLSLRIGERRTLLLVVDLVLVNLTTLLALWIWAVRGGIPFDREFIVRQVEWFVLLTGLWLGGSLFVGLYDLSRITLWSTAAGALARTIALVIFTYLIIYFFLPEPGALPRGVVVYQGVMAFVMIALWRAFFLTLIRQPIFARRTVIVGAGKAGREIARLIKQRARAHYHIVGFIDDDESRRGTRVEIGDGHEGKSHELPILGTGRDLVHRVKEHRVPEVILAVTNDIDSGLFSALLECKIQGIEITLMPLLYEQLTGQVPVDHIGRNWNVALPLETAEAGGWYPLAKRVFDIVGALLGLVFFLPLLPFLAIAIRLNSPGPVFYSQSRVGRGGRRFDLLKLRTMIVDAEKDGAKQAQRNDPRVTAVGKWLRKLRLDEMPQLFNVLVGDMSAVGPRPERPEHIGTFDQVIPFHRLRNSVKPGMAGWAVINYDYIDSIEDAKIRLQYDLYYIKHQSLWLDLVILLRTLGQVIALKGR